VPSHPLLSVKSLSVLFEGSDSPVVDHISFDIPAQSTVGLVGESGSGKSLTALSLVKLTPNSATLSGQVFWGGRDLLSLKDTQLRPYRGAEIGFIFQNPLAALNPVYSIGHQFIETIRHHHNLSKKDAEYMGINALRDVQIPFAERRFWDYPHQFSLGMCQRVMIALTLVMSPKLLIADEPTASLDVTVQAQILDLLAQLKEKEQMSMLLISHDLGVISQNCDYVLVMYRGQLVEQGSPERIFHHPQHPYTQLLVNAIPSFNKPRLAIPVTQEFSEETGCRFYHRCPLGHAKCQTAAPTLQPTSAPEHSVACFALE